MSTIIVAKKEGNELKIVQVELSEYKTKYAKDGYKPLGLALYEIKEPVAQSKRKT